MATPTIPVTPVTCLHSPEVYTDFIKLISRPDIHGLGANVHDLEILRLACLEKVRRKQVGRKCGRQLSLNFLRHIWADWAEQHAKFWEEGIGIGWNLLVSDDHPNALWQREGFGQPVDAIFALCKLPARLPLYDCELHQTHALCWRNVKAPPLTEEELLAWNRLLREDADWRSGESA